MLWVWKWFLNVFDLVAVQSPKANYDLIVFFGMIQM